MVMDASVDLLPRDPLNFTTLVTNQLYVLVTTKSWDIVRNSQDILLHKCPHLSLKIVSRQPQCSNKKSNRSSTLTGNVDPMSAAGFGWHLCGALDTSDGRVCELPPL
jgi:hypothetical protein